MNSNSLEKKEQIDRIAGMEKILDEAGPLLSEMESLLDRYEKLLPELKILFDYYHSPTWMADHDEDEQGKIPSYVKRGVLSEDAIWNLETEQQCICKQLQKILEELS